MLSAPAILERSQLEAIGLAPKAQSLNPRAASKPIAAAPTPTGDYYLEHPRVAGLSAEQAEAIRTALDMRVHCGGHDASSSFSSGSSSCPSPVGSFIEASFPQYALDALRAASFIEPTPIQKQAWPIAMSGLDLIGLAETGSGKTLAYLLPVLVHINAQPLAQPGDGPLALMLAPTRELATQIHEEAVRFGHPCGVRTACVVGGVPQAPQIHALRKCPELIIATPGRLCDMLSSRKTSLQRCTYLVLDEADRMLDLGFEPQIRQLLQHACAERQTLLFSATWPADVQVLATACHCLPLLATACH